MRLFIFFLFIFSTESIPAQEKFKLNKIGIQASSSFLKTKNLDFDFFEKYGELERLSLNDFAEILVHEPFGGSAFLFDFNWLKSRKDTFSESLTIGLEYWNNIRVWYEIYDFEAFYESPPYTYYFYLNMGSVKGRYSFNYNITKSTRASIGPELRYVVSMNNTVEQYFGVEPIVSSGKSTHHITGAIHGEIGQTIFKRVELQIAYFIFMSQLIGDKVSFKGQGINIGLAWKW